MVAITEAAIRELAGLRGELAPITTCYLDVDGRRLPRRRHVEQELEGLVREAKQRANGDQSVSEDLKRIADYVRSRLDRHRTRGLAFFACSAQGLWEVIELPVPVHTQLVINQTPAVGQLESVAQQHEPIGVLLADRRRARLFVFELGELLERTELIDELPRNLDARGDRERGTPENHVEELAHQHLRHAARAAFDLWRQRPFEHLVLGAPEQIASELERDLHPYLRRRLRGRIHVSVGASLDDVRRSAEAVELEVERRREAALVERLRSSAATGRKGVVGLAATLAALGERRVEHLLVSEGFAAEGWRCPATGALFAVGPTSPSTGEPMQRVQDVVEEAIQSALIQEVAVTMCAGNADLDVLGRIGALLRY